MPFEINGRPGGAIAVRPQPVVQAGGARIGVDYRARVFRRGVEPGWCQVRILDGRLSGSEGWVPDQAIVPAAAETVASDQELDQLFQLLRTATFTASDGSQLPIPYRYPKDGCYARAEIMTRLLRTCGYTVDKEFAIATKGLTVRTSHGGDIADWGESLRVDWWYHVAPVVYAAEGHPLTAVVLDPSVSDTPLTPAGWLETMTADPVPAEVKYDALRNGLLASRAYPADRTVLVRAGGDVYAPPSPANPAVSVLGAAQDPVTALTIAASRVPAHDVVAAFDAFFRGCHQAQLSGARDVAVPYPTYGQDRQQVHGRLGALRQQDRLYIATAFPKFLEDWGNTFLGTGIEADVRALIQAIG